MKRVLCYLCLAVVAFSFASCSGGGSYNAAECAKLEEKIKNNSLTESDYGDMIDQMDGILQTMIDKDEELKDSPEKLEEFSKSEEAAKLVNYMLTFGLTLDSHEADLSASNKAKLAKVQKKYENKMKK